MLSEAVPEAHFHPSLGGVSEKQTKGLHPFESLDPRNGPGLICVFHCQGIYCEFGLK